MFFFSGVMLTIGRSNYMRFNHPAEAKIMKSVLPNPRISMAPITFEPDNIFQCKFTKKPPVVPKKNSKEIIADGVEEPVPSSIMTKVSKFEYLAQQNFKKAISPKVFSSNLVTVNTPAKDVLGKSPPDLQNYSKNLPQNVLNYSELNHNDKKQNKNPDRPLFGKKSPQYVNVTLNDAKNINNRVILFENGSVGKNLSLDHNELNNKMASVNKNVNVNRALTPSPNLSNTSTSHSFKSLSSSPGDFHRSGSASELSDFSITQRHSEAELKRSQVIFLFYFLLLDLNLFS